MGDSEIALVSQEDIYVIGNLIWELVGTKLVDEAAASVRGQRTDASVEFARIASC